MGGVGGVNLTYASECLSVYASRFCVSAGIWEASLTYSSRLSVYIWKFCVSGGVGVWGKRQVLLILHVRVSIFRDFASVLG